MSMLSANVFSAMVLQNLNSGSSPSPLCSIPQYAHNNGADVPNINNKKNKKQNPSRRCTVASFVQVALFSCPGSAAAAAARGSIVDVNGFEHALLETWLVHGSSDMRCTLGSSSQRHFRKKAGLVLAYQGQHTPSDSSLGLLGCLIFGLLFLKERLARTASDASLEDVHQRLRKADKELRLQTRNSVTSKLVASQVVDNNGMDGGSNEALLRQLVNARSNLIEVGDLLDKSRGMSESLKRQASSLEASIREMERDCGLFAVKIEEQLEVRHSIEEVLRSMETNLLLKANEVNSLRAGFESREEAYHVNSNELGLVESLLGKAIEAAYQAENKANNMGIALFASHGLEESLSEELKAAMTRNETLENEINGATKCTQEETASASASLRELKEHLEVKGRESEALSGELIKKWDELHSHKKIVSQLMKDRDERRKVLKETQSRIDGLLELLHLAENSFTISQKELADLHQLLCDVQAQSRTLERGQESALGELAMVSSELENRITTEKELITRLREELRDVHMALTSSSVDISTLQKSMEAISASQLHLREQLGGLHETKQAYMVALKKEKRASAYAKKKLASCEKILAEENVALEGLRTDLERERMRLQDLKVEVSSRTAELDKTRKTSAHLVDKDSPLEADKQTLGKGPEQSNKVLTPVGGRPRRQSVSKQTRPKVGKNP